MLESIMFCSGFPKIWKAVRDSFAVPKILPSPGTLYSPTSKIPSLVIFKTTGRQCNAGDCMKLYNANKKGQAALQQEPFFLEIVSKLCPEMMSCI